MPGEQHEDLPIEVVLRMLGEYSTKVAAGLRRRATKLAFLGLFALLGSTGTWIFYSLGTSAFLSRIVLLYGAMIVTVVILGLLRDRPELQLAVWQLRRIYELASRIEDIGSKTDFAHRFEFELRLSEALFLINRAEGIVPGDKKVWIVQPEVGRVMRQGGNNPQATLEEALPADHIR